MTDLERILKLAKADGGKFFVIDEKGDPSLVIMSVEEYERILLKKIQDQVEDIEQINRKIIEAQKTESADTAAQLAEARRSQQESLRSEVIDSTFDFEPPLAEEGSLQSGAQWEDI